MEEKIYSILESILKMERETLLDRFDCQDAWDSLLRVEVLFAVEDELGLSFDEQELAELTTPKLLFDRIMSRAAD